MDSRIATKAISSRRYLKHKQRKTIVTRLTVDNKLGTVVAEDTGELVTLGKTSRRKGSDAESAATSKGRVEDIV